MEERKLNFNAPLLSVRRFSGTSSFQDRNKQNKFENPPPTARFALPWHCPDASSDQVKEPVAVPFVWEQIPGKAKGSVELEFEPFKEALGIPRLPPGRISKVVKCPVAVLWRKNCLNEKCVSGSDNDDDVYSDALDTLTDAFSMNCSISGLSGSDGPRFLPAAMAVTLETPKYALRKQSVAPEQPTEAKKAVIADRKPPVNSYESAIVPYYNWDAEQEEETEDEFDGYQDTGNLSRKACGLLPRLCFKSSHGLLYPVPGLKVRSHSSMSFS
ncbi:Xylem bark cysteine peptidase 3 isoform 1 [Hibiscus syriacus]|uniref:Xylem bark cysteine peptidase 3 isoform 1 n=1 Tax=Hibiscus syriacus TaxID=106335 RepID=A0A6A2XW81_HIBSY|nr:Xylem bark cysteine peptidase 3 isoform 1 [Hibiscus syriacus]